MRPTTTRRQFLATSAMAAASLALGVPNGPPELLAWTRDVRRRSASELLPETMATDVLQTLALAAVDAARQSGATFADIRIGEQHTLSASVWPNSRIPSILLWTDSGYGIRVLVDGAWGFMHGNLLTVEAVTNAAQSATRKAKAHAAVNARFGRRGVSLAAAPVARGEWSTPVGIAPMSVPLDEYARTLAALAEQGNRRWRMTLESWIRSTTASRVFASTEGSLVSQQFTRVDPGVGFLYGEYYDRTRGAGWFTLPGVDPQSGGFEVMLDPTFPDRIEAFTDTLMPLAQLPSGTMDVGRYPLVVDGLAFGALVGTMVSPALELDRVMGEEIDASGSSYLAPARDTLAASKPTFSPLFTLRSESPLPSYCAAKWDDEGVTPASFSLIDKGRVVDFMTTRESAQALTTWYQQHNLPTESRGSSIVAQTDDMPLTGGGHHVVQPNTTRSTLMDLCRDIRHGLLLQYGGWTIGSPTLATGDIRLSNSGLLLEIKDGKPVGRLPQNINLQFRTTKLFQDSLGGVGDASTTATRLVRTTKGLPWQGLTRCVTAPAALVKEINLTVDPKQS